MAEETRETDDQLILGVITPKRFVQGMAMLPAATLLAAQFPGGWQWLAASLGAAGTLLVGIVVAKALLSGRDLNRMFWMLLVMQVAALVFVIVRMDYWPF